jgi:hypothetical protein
MTFELKNEGSQVADTHQHHLKAAEHCDAASVSHKEAAKHVKNGDLKSANSHCEIARGHIVKANEHCELASNAKSMSNTTGMK